jgi:hypothetical protein
MKAKIITNGFLSAKISLKESCEGFECESYGDSVYSELHQDIVPLDLWLEINGEERHIISSYSDDTSDEEMKKEFLYLLESYVDEEEVLKELDQLVILQSKVTQDEVLVEVKSTLKDGVTLRGAYDKKSKNIGSYYIENFDNKTPSEIFDDDTLKNNSWFHEMEFVVALAKRLALR